VDTPATATVDIERPALKALVMNRAVAAVGVRLVLHERE
jgi:hypothetical protein